MGVQDPLQHVMPVPIPTEICLPATVLQVFTTKVPALYALHATTHVLLVQMAPHALHAPQLQKEYL